MRNEVETRNPPMEVQTERRPGCLVLRISGDLRLWNREEQQGVLLNQFADNVEPSTTHVVLSLHSLTHIDTKGINTLVRVLLQCLKREITPSIILPPGLAGDALRRTRIFGAWSKFEDEQAAFQAIESV